MKSNKILVIGLTWPEPNSTGAGVRMMQLLQVLLDYKYDITFVSTALETTFSFDLNTIGIKTRRILLNDATFDNFAITLSPDIVLFDRFLTEEQFGWRIAEKCPNAIRILDTEDLHSLRQVREECTKKGLPFTAKTWLIHDKTKREIASILRSDLSLIISSYEMTLLKDEVKVDKRYLLHLPFMVNEIKNTDDWPFFEQRKDFIFIGSGKHSPNLDAITYLKSNIWPKIRKLLPKANIQIYGSYLPQKVLEMHNAKDGFLVKGRANGVKKVMSQARICLAPIRFGAGIKGKLLDAMQFGTPSVTTSIGAEGMSNEKYWNGKITDEIDAFVQASTEIYLEKEKWTEAQKNGIELINRIYAKPKLSAFFMTAINNILENKEEHRDQNFMGRLLMHQNFNATKYMSKWIEEKNKQ